MELNAGSLLPFFRDQLSAQSRRTLAVGVLGRSTAKADQDLAAFFAEDRKVAGLIDAIGPSAQLLLALLIEAREASQEVVIGEAARIVGHDAAARGWDVLVERGLLFCRQQWGWRGTVRRIYLPDPLAARLGPEVAGLIEASEPAREAPPLPGDVPPVDPSARVLLALAAVATVQPRPRADGEPYKKDVEKMAALGGTAEAEALAGFCRLEALRLVRCDERIEPDWAAVDRWMAAGPAVRARALLGSVRRDAVWSRLVSAAGAWVAEDDLARSIRVRWDPPSVPIEPRRAADLAGRAWDQWRSENLAGWPEVERAEAGGRAWYRIGGELGAALSGRAPPRAPLHVQPNFEVIAPREAVPEDLALLARGAALRRADVVATFALTPESVRRAVISGLGADALCERLAAASAHGLPEAVAASIRDWARDTGRSRVSLVALIRLDDEQVATRAAPVLAGVAERIAPDAFVADTEAWSDVVARLERAGIAPRERPTAGREHRAGPYRRAEYAHDDAGNDGAAEPVPPPARLGLALPPARVQAARKLREAAAAEAAREAAGARAPAAKAAAARAAAAKAAAAKARAARLKSPAARHGNGGADGRFSGILLRALERLAGGDHAARAGADEDRDPYLDDDEDDEDEDDEDTGDGEDAVVTDPDWVPGDGWDALVDTVQEAGKLGADLAVRTRADRHVRMSGVAWAGEGGRRGGIEGTDARGSRPCTVRADSVAAVEILRATARRVGRNDRCPCGSGLKFKRCCLLEGDRPPASV